MATGGSITVENDGAYIARFYVKYTAANGQRITKDSGDFGFGVTKTIDIPRGSTDIVVKAEEMWGFGWTTIFTMDSQYPFTKKIVLHGTTLDPYYKELPDN